MAKPESRMRRPCSYGPLLSLAPVLLLSGCDSSTAEPEPTDRYELAFLSSLDGAVDLYAARSDGTGFRRITEDAVEESWYAWSPDGSRIAMRRTGADIGADVGVMNADGSGLYRLTESPAAESRIRWSPDGSRISFDADNELGGLDVFVVPAGGGPVTNLTGPSQQVNGQARWSTDGSRIVYHRRPERGQRYDIYVMNADGSVALGAAPREHSAAVKRQRSSASALGTNPGRIADFRVL